MAIICRKYISVWVIACVICKIQAAAVQQNSVTGDLNGKINDDAEQSATYGPFETDHYATNDSKVIIDLYTPTQRPKPKESPKNESAEKNATPFVQLMITNKEVIKDATPKSDEIAEKTTTTTPKIPTSTGRNRLPLIPPASVNASIRKFEHDSKQKQGSIIIRYALFH